MPPSIRSPDAPINRAFLGRVLFSEVDPFLVAGDSDVARREALAEARRVAGIVFASSRTPQEMLRFLDHYRHPADFIGENGALLAVRSGAMADAIGRCVRWEGKGSSCFIRRLGRNPVELLQTIRDISAGAPVAQWIDTLNRESMVERQAVRSASVLIPTPLADHPAMVAGLELLRQAGLQVALSQRWITIWDGPTKSDTATRYLDAVASVTGRRPFVGAVGHAGHDEPLLRMADVGWAMPDQEHRYSAALCRVPGVRLCCECNCRGWSEVAAQFAAIHEEGSCRRTIVRQ
jgi:predicted mannosyl-3-phosphoglycerate phosphatase (HAD superfamily)